MKNLLYSFVIALLILPIVVFSAENIVLLTDFGTKDGAVSAMKGVIYSVDKEIIVSDLTHEIPAYDIWEASYRLYQTASYWPKGTVFVNVIDPGVGTERRSIVAKSKTGHYFVGPDNGTLTWIEEKFGLEEVREIDLSKHRLASSLQSFTFFGRDVYAYTAAKLASGKITFEEVGEPLATPLIKLSYQKVKIENNKIIGTILILDKQYGNVWTNIEGQTLREFGVKAGKQYKVTIYNNDKVVYDEIITFHDTFGNAKKGDNLLYVNSLLNLAIATNQADFASTYHIDVGNHWKFIVEKA